MYTVGKSTLLILRVRYIVYYIIFHPYIILSQTMYTVGKSTLSYFKYFQTLIIPGGKVGLKTGALLRIITSY